MKLQENQLLTKKDLAEFFHVGVSTMEKNREEIHIQKNLMNIALLEREKVQKVKFITKLQRFLQKMAQKRVEFTPKTIKNTVKRF